MNTVLCKTLYAVRIWGDSLCRANVLYIYEKGIIPLVLRSGFMYKTVSYQASFVIACVVPFDLRARELRWGGDHQSRTEIRAQTLLDWLNGHLPWLPLGPEG